MVSKHSAFRLDKIKRKKINMDREMSTRWLIQACLHGYRSYCMKIILTIQERREWAKMVDNFSV